MTRASSSKNLSGSTRRIAPRGHSWTQFEYEWPRHRLHLIARLVTSALGRSFSSSGRIVMLTYGHLRAQFSHPMQLSLMSTSPSANRWIAPVGQPIMHSGSRQCRQLDGSMMSVSYTHLTLPT